MAKYTGLAVGLRITCRNLLLHLSTNYSGAAIANPELTCPIAHLGAASSTLDNLARNRFLADLTDPLCWAATEIPHLVQADHTFGELTAYPAFYEPPAVHADIYRAFISSLTSADGTISIANLPPVTHSPITHS